jgi:pyridoxamine 5'-phosphate oxidase
VVMTDPAGLRAMYTRGSLDEADIAGTWAAQLRLWFETAAADPGVLEANAIQLATAGADGQPTVRTVLAKGIDERGIVFFTNYTSRKSHQLRTTRHASVTFPWYALQRQVSLRGKVEKVSVEESRAYWVTRPRGSQLGAWASAQSTTVRDRAALDAALAAVERRFADTPEVPLPPHWGGWRIVPDRVEFWQGRTNRMHDRLRFEQNALDRTWRVQRLAP